MADPARCPNAGPERPVVQGGGQADSRPCAAEMIRVRVLTPGLTVGLLLGIPALLYVVPRHDESVSVSVVPPLARARIETRGGIVGQLIFHPHEVGLYSGDALVGGVRLWDPNTGLSRSRFEDPFPDSDSQISAMALAPDGRTLAAGIYEKGVVLWNTATGSMAARLAPESWHASALVFTPDGRACVAAGWDGIIRTWDTSTWKARDFWSSQGEGGWTCLALSPDGRTMAAGGKSGWMRSWDLVGGRPQATMQGDGSPFRCVAYSPDGRTLAAGSWRGRIRLWDATTHRERPGPGETNLSSIVCIAYSSDGRCLATGHEDRVIRLWDPETGRLRRELTGHRSSVRSLAFAPDGRRMASGSSDATILLWDLPEVLAPRRNSGGRSGTNSSHLQIPDQTGTGTR